MNASSARTVLITGANKGIGYEIARQLGAAGLRIWLGARNAEAGEAAAATLREGGADVRAVPTCSTRRRSPPPPPASTRRTAGWTC